MSGIMIFSLNTSHCYPFKGLSLHQVKGSLWSQKAQAVTMLNLLLNFKTIQFHKCIAYAICYKRNFSLLNNIKGHSQFCWCRHEFPYNITVIPFSNFKLSFLSILISIPLTASFSFKKKKIKNEWKIDREEEQTNK